MDEKQILDSIKYACVSANHNLNQIQAFQDHGVKFICDIEDNYSKTERLIIIALIAGECDTISAMSYGITFAGEAKDWIRTTGEAFTAGFSWGKYNKATE